MKKRLALSLLMLILHFTALSQSKADSLRHVLQNTTGEQARITVLNQLSFELNYSDPDQAQQYAREAIALGSKINDQKSVAAAYRNLAIVQQNLGNYHQALAYADSAASIYEKIPDSIGMTAVYSTKGNLSYYLSDFRQALRFYEQAYNIYDNAGLTSRSAIMINNIALVLMEMSNYTEALNKYFEALQLQDDIQNEPGKALTLRSIGMAYFNLRNFDKAIEYYQQSLEICERLNDEFGIAAAYSNIGNALGMKGKPAEALARFEKALKIFEEKRDMNSMALVYAQMGHYQALSGEDEQALEYLEKAIQINRQTGNRHNLGYVLHDLALLQIRKRQFDPAFENLQQCEEIFRETGDVNMLSQTFDAFSKYHEQSGDYRRSLDYFRKFNRIKDSLFAIEADERIAAAEWRYESEKHEAESERLLHDNRLKELQIQSHRQSRNFFLALAGIILLAALFLFYRYRIKQKTAAILKQKNKELAEQSAQIQRQKEKIESQYSKLKELDEAKTRFFANISHEFRTPLTLIQGPLDDVLGSDDAKLLSEDSRFRIRLAHRNIRQLHSLVEQLLDLSKIKAGKMKLRAERQNLAGYLRRVVNTFESAIPRHKKIVIDFSCEPKELWLFYDAEKMDQIINNLISNAIKSIDASGEINLSLKVPFSGNQPDGLEAEFAEIVISDNGKGIPAADLPKIFDRFFRAGDSSLQNEPGTGIGLELTRELVELHGGSISAESEPGKGSIFTLQLPLGSAHLDEDEIIEEMPSEPIDEDTAISAATDEAFAATTPAGQKFCVLVVEDHQEMREYIAGHLAGEFRLLQASNGREALKIIEQQLPDLIVSDLMMPEMDGLALLSQIRNSKKTGDIPFVLLTAKASDEDRMSGYQQKADAYITKPFQAGELLLRIRNLLESREAVKEKYSHKIISVELAGQHLAPADQQFLEKMKEAVLQNMADDEFGIQQIAEKAFLSERQLRRKLTELTGLTPIDFIRQIRLQQAKLLIEKNVYNTISEVSATVGFNNPAYFSRLFKKMFGQTPQEMLKAAMQ
jgi:signal transduction histidine kinase/DNA-binding response OmpR family regulator/tetratricopeptide (TPR) repeat protein